MRRIVFTLLILSPWISLAQQRVVQDILSLKNSGQQFHNVELVGFETADLSRNPDLAGLRKGVLLKPDLMAIADLKSSGKTLVSLSIPVGDRQSIILDLMEHDILDHGFRLFASDNPGVPVPYSGGKHYRGMIRGDHSSIAALSVFNDELMGLISSDAGNLVLGKLSGSREHLHIIYNDADLETRPDWECATPDDGGLYTKEQLSSQIGQRDVGDCVKVYIEIDDDIVTNKGGATNATNYITGLFNQSITLYANESIAMSISEILAWTTPAPYSGGTSSAMLSSFQNNTGSFNGNLAHLVSYQASGGIAAGFNGICNSNPDNSKCFSSIDGSYNTVPTYSWSVMVVTHEMGHLIGSRHTHACVWNGNNTAIDGCAGSTEGGCPLPGNPPGGGTIMSYCHLQSVGINFNLGFGPQPGNVIRNTVNATGNCLTTCGGPPPPPQYCASNGTSQQYEWIQSVSLGSINNNSGSNGGYGDFTAQSTSLSTGTAYTITLTPGFSGSAYNEVWRVWIDYNNDMDWSDAGEQVVATSGNNARVVSFTVPSSSPAVTTRMRVSMQYNTAPPICGSFTYGEVEDYTVVIGGGGGPTCTDGVQNGQETGVDCGGPVCPPCPTCTDGIQNGQETGVDCGGPVCPPCPTCSDGIQNGDETGVDCGGSVCPPCPTCTDGVQNGDEEGVDCGGSCPNPCPGGSTVIFGHYFESGWDGWADGGSDCARYSGSRSWEGSYSINLQDNSGTGSAMTSPAVNLTGYSSVELEFYFYSWSMENGEDFWVRYYNGSTYTTVAAYAAGTSFTNGSFWVATVTLTSAQVNFVSNARFRFQCDASDNNDDIYIDAVTLTGFTGSLPEEGQRIATIERVEKEGRRLVSSDPGEISLYPNPTSGDLRIDYDGTINEVRVISSTGEVMRAIETDLEMLEFSVEDIPAGIYILMVRSGENWIPRKFVKL